MKITKSKFILMIVVLVSISMITASDFNPVGITTDKSSECNQCHGGSHKGAVAYTVSMGISESLLNSTPNRLSVSVNNEKFGLSDVKLTIVDNPEFNIDQSQKSVNLGYISRGSVKTAKWQITPMVSINKTIEIVIEFSGVARDHKTYTYTQTLKKSVFVSVTPTPILFVSTTHFTDTTLITGSNGSGLLEITNFGNLEMTDISVATLGHIKIQDHDSNFTIPSILPQESYTFRYIIDTTIKSKNSIIVSYIGDQIQSVITSILVADQPPLPLSILLGRILGYITYFLLFLSTLTGIGRYQLKSKFSARKLKILHADLSNISFVFVILHGIILSLNTSSWSTVYRWFELLPEDWKNSDNLGLNIGRLGLLFMYTSILSGYYFTKIIRKLGRKTGIYIHMLSYLAFIGGIVHAIMIGGTASNFIVIILLVSSIFLISWLKYEDYKRGKLRRARRKTIKSTISLKDKAKESLEKGKKKLITSVLYVNDMRSSRKGNIGIVCWNCVTLNDSDAIYCKKCGKKVLEEKN